MLELLHQLVEHLKLMHGVEVLLKPLIAETVGLEMLLIVVLLA
jgi:hypothetical protein